MVLGPEEEVGVEMCGEVSSVEEGEGKGEWEREFPLSLFFVPLLKSSINYIIK